jgi:uncharacterized membrane protein
VAGITVSTLIEAPPAEVWADIADLASHVEWMADAEAIRFTTNQRSGVGASFDCDTRVGWLRLTDRMEITEWIPEWVIGVRHVGVITGSGRLTLAPAPGDATDFTWTETLTFPIWLGGRLGAVLGGAVLWLIWSRNLAALKRRIEQGRT